MSGLELDETDFRILRLLRENSRTPLRELAQAANVSIPTARTRMKKLVAVGVLGKFTVAIDPQRLAGAVTAFITLKAKLPDIGAAAESLGGMDEVSEAYLTTGEHDLVLKVSVPDMKALEEFVFQKLSKISGVELYHTSFVVEAVKEQFGPTLRPGFGVKIRCNECGKQISGEMVRKVVGGREQYFCCQTCATTFVAKHAR